MPWSTSALLLLLGVAAGPYGLNMLSAPILVLLDPLIVMALAMLGVFIGLAPDACPQSGSPAFIAKTLPTSPAVLAVLAGIAMAAMRDPSPMAAALMALGIAGVAMIIGFAGWLLIGQADSEREQQVFVIGSLLLLGGAAAYASLSALFAGFLAGIAWSSGGDLARARIVHHLDYFRHPLLVVMLLAAGASISFSADVLAVLVIVAALHAVGRPVTTPFPVSAGVAAIAVALDIFRGALR